MKKNAQTVLVIEDDHFQQELLKVWLASAGYQVLIADSGEQALQMIGDYHPDLILLDLVMPGLDGFQVAKELKENPETRQIPVVVVTVMDAQDKRIQALEIGVDDFLSKPLDRIELLVRVKNLLQSRAYFKQLQDRQAHLLQLESLASIGTLISSVTREIYKPLHGLHGIIEQAQQQSTGNTQVSTLLAQAVEHIDRIDLVTHNMQLYIKSISAQSSSEVCDAARVLEQVLELLGSKMAEAGIRIQTEVEADLPRVQCSSEGLMHVLVHLVLNAYEALANTPAPQIHISINTTEDNHIVLAVCDNNADVSENMYSLIVDPLFSTKLPGVCHSLGLALACHFIEKSGGTISIDCIAGRGSCMKAVLKTA